MLPIHLKAHTLNPVWVSFPIYGTSWITGVLNKQASKCPELQTEQQGLPHCCSNIHNILNQVIQFKRRHPIKYHTSCINHEWHRVQTTLTTMPGVNTENEYNLTKSRIPYNLRNTIRKYLKQTSPTVPKSQKHSFRKLYTFQVPHSSNTTSFFKHNTNFVCDILHSLTS